MKRPVKIVCITLGSIVGLVLVVAIAAVITVSILLKPEKLTKIVNKVAGDYVTCPYHIGQVDLCIFRTFPNVGLRVEDVYLINPMQGAQSDTLLAVPELIVGIDVKKYLDNRELCVEQVYAENVVLNAYIDAEGKNNWSVLSLPEDTTETDTTATVLPFSIDVEDLRLSTRQLSLVSKADSLSLENLSLSLYAKATADTTLSSIALQIDSAMLGWDGLTLGLAGEVCMEDAIEMNLHATTNTWQLSHLLAILPEQFAFMPDNTELDGRFDLAADVVGTYDDHTMPIVDLTVGMKDAAGHYDLSTLPYQLHDMYGMVTIHVDLNDKEQTRARIHELRLHTGETAIGMKGDVTKILLPDTAITMGNPLCDVQLDLGIDLPDAEYWLEDETTDVTLRGRLSGTLDVVGTLDDIADLNFQNLRAESQLKVPSLYAHYGDSIEVKASEVGLSFALPRKGEPTSKALSAKAQLTAARLHADAYGILADVEDGKVDAEYEQDLKDTLRVPFMSIAYRMGCLTADMDTIHAHAHQVHGTASMAATRRDKSAPRMGIHVAAERLEANMGQEHDATMDNVAFATDVRYDQKGDNVLLQWNPKVQVQFQNGLVHSTMLPTELKVPSIDFTYTNKECHINRSQLILGNSDFSLSGQMQNMEKWMRHDGTLEGEFTLYSHHTDANQLMDFFSADSGSEETEEAAPAEAVKEQQPLVAVAEPDSEKEANPFLVPTSVDLTLNTQIDETEIFNQTATNLAGRIYVRNGLLVLEEVGFVCRAARLQLTAMYRTPRRNHLYLGFDYHMLDIDIRELISMIPDLETMVPMLSSFKGAAEFHLAAETYLNAKYEPKTSTLRGACSVFGKNLVLMDNETFSTISKYLMFSKKTENIVDSISAEITLYKDEIDVYPFCLSIDNYMAAVGGRHNLDMSFDYHVSLLKPIYLGVDVTGTFDDLHIGLAKCRYAQDFRPLFHRKVDTQSAELRAMIRQSMQRNVKIQ